MATNEKVILLALIASLIIAAAALAARWVIWLRPAVLQRAVPRMQALTVGLLVGDALMHIFPDAIAQGISPTLAGGAASLGLIAMLCLETWLRSRPQTGDVAYFARMDIAADALHHFVDGLVVGASFLVSIDVGLLLALVIALHELPREAGNAGVLVAGDYSPRRAFRISLFTTAAVPVGTLAIVGTAASGHWIGLCLAVAAGATLYVACCDLLPAFWRHDADLRRRLPAYVLVGLVFMAALATLGHGHG